MQTDVGGARTLGRFLDGELHALSFAEQFEHDAAHGAAMEEVLESRLIANEAETLVDQEPCNGALRHVRALRSERDAAARHRYS